MGGFTTSISGGAVALSMSSTFLQLLVETGMTKIEKYSLLEKPGRGDGKIVEELYSC